MVGPGVKTARQARFPENRGTCVEQKLPGKKLDNPGDSDGRVEIGATARSGVPDRVLTYGVPE